MNSDDIAFDRKKRSFFDENKDKIANQMKENQFERPNKRPEFDPSQRMRRMDEPNKPEFFPKPFAERHPNFEKINNHDFKRGRIPRMRRHQNDKQEL